MTVDQKPMYQTVSTRAKYCFGIGAIGKDAIVNLVSVFLMLYLTDTLYLSPAFVGTLFFIARIWDAFNDPMMGMIVDNTRSKYGKFRIWLVVGTLLNAIVFVLMFTSLGLSGTSLYVYIAIIYILYGMTYTIMDVPYWSWLPNLTNDPHEREKVSVIPRFFASFAGFLIATFGLGILKWFNDRAGAPSNRSEIGFTHFAIVVAILFIVTIGITVLNVKEKSTLGTKATKTSFKQAFHIIIKNDQLVSFIGLLLTFNLATQIVKSFAVYYFKDVIGNEWLYSIFGFAWAAEMVGLIVFPRVARLMPRQNVYAWSCGLVVCGVAILGIAGLVLPQNLIILIIGCAMMALGSGMSLGVTTCCIADVIDYGEVKFGVRNESITCSSQTFLMKLAMAAAGGLTGVGLQAVGYNAKLTQQAASTVSGIRFFTIVLPIIFAALSYFIYHKSYQLKGKKLEEVAIQLNQKHAMDNEA